ncbi:uncharacterized protein LOC143025211 [Oratosquilla oratoria]|uniref:uncharacterized protein LOC143025211 n=1 Tax=Oratosquilla oratoria TaxID=337810 RepID=UPI003F767DFC
MRPQGLVTWLCVLTSPLLPTPPQGERSDQGSTSSSFRGGGGGVRGGRGGGDGGGGGGKRAGGFADALRVVKVDVPFLVPSGGSVQLVCQYDLEGDQLYALTWWKGVDQFYQYSPDSPIPITYNAPGVLVDVERSGGNIVVLRNVSTTSTGRYMCEVLAENPSFEKDSKWKWMEVIDDPRASPLIELSPRPHAPGHVLTANCSLTSTTAQAPLLEWFLNGKKVPEQLVRPLVNHRGSPTLQLRLRLRPSHFARHGRAHLTCTESITGLYRRSSEVVLIPSSQKTASPVQKLYGSGSPGHREAFISVLVGLVGVLTCGRGP